MREILGGRPQQRDSPNVDVSQSGFQCCARVGHGLHEGVKIADHDIYRRNLVFCQLRHLTFIISLCQDASMNRWMQRLDSPP